MSLNREIISTQNAPAAIGPYSQGVRVGDFVFTAGQIGLVPATGQLIDGGIDEQTRQVMRNLAGILATAGSDLDKIIKTTIFVTDIGDFAAVNQVYGSFFAANPPARSTVQVAALPLGAKVEIEAVAVVTGA
ncbi:MAG: RidA family protein [Chloroflexota bacterium]